MNARKKTKSAQEVSLPVFSHKNILSGVKRIKILVVDDHKLVREGLRQFLQMQNRFKVDVYEAEDGQQAIHLYRSLGDVDLVLMDVKMPGKNGIDATREICALDKKARILALSMHDEDRIVKEILRAGACGYVLKSAGIDEMLEAMGKAMAGEKYFTREIMLNMLEPYYDYIIEGRIPVTNAKMPTLTPREQSVLVGIINERTNEEMSQDLRINKRTVERHRTNLMCKLGVKSPLGLVKYAVQMGIIKSNRYVILMALGIKMYFL